MGGPLTKYTTLNERSKGYFVLPSVQEQVISIQPGLPPGGTHPIDGVITFPPIDHNRVLQPHEDAPDSDFRDQRLRRFNKASTTSLGDVVLLVQVGPIVHNVQFSVVEDLFPFNTIMGCTWLHGIKVIMSTYHQMVAREVGSTSDGEPPMEPTGEME
ncbi:hypothetical protein CK203_056783 [Vitis vinifera]|uniref:Uncharacterized protein n=1 Tax=Vitis vinifera TaxID=29760 RepID=A0A438FVD7_VITVI|nr:hypothetical protein CK203_056783 [Vitis vinifera]